MDLRLAARVKGGPETYEPLSRHSLRWEMTRPESGSDAEVKIRVTAESDFSGGSANRYTYALGLLTADSAGDLLDPRSWSKSVTPVLTFCSVDGEYGPGHNSFFTGSDGELMIAYHAETGLAETLRCDGIRRVHLRPDGTPYFGLSASEDLGRASVSARIIVG